jgi:hypothetical protein
MEEKQNETQNNSQSNQTQIVAEIPQESQSISQKSIILFPTTVLLILISIFTGYLLYQNMELKKALKINSFEDCAKESGIIQESYPRVCITKDGRRFTEVVKENPPEEINNEPTPLPIPEEEISETPASEPANLKNNNQSID